MDGMRVEFWAVGEPAALPERVSCGRGLLGRMLRDEPRRVGQRLRQCELVYADPVKVAQGISILQRRQPTRWPSHPVMSLMRG